MRVARNHRMLVGFLLESNVDLREHYGNYVAVSDLQNIEFLQPIAGSDIYG